LLVAFAGCKASRWSGPKTATEIDVAGFKLTIPEGWRSTAELNNAGDLAKYRPGPHSVGMMPEVDRDGVLTAMIVVASQPSTVSAWTSCAQAVEAARALDSRPISDVHDGGSACTWHVALGPLVGTVGIRRAAEREVSVRCVIDAAGDREAERVCNDVLRSLQMR
jgi:hypothetical protein